MSKIIAIANQKGGVGKTTTCVNLCCALKMKGKKVLILDCDPQGNSTSGMGVDKYSTPGAYELIAKKADIYDCIRKTPYGDVIPSNKELSGATVKVYRTAVGGAVKAAPGTIVRADKTGIEIACGDGLTLRILELQPQNGKRMAVASYLAGHPVQVTV